jgi:putative heme utilization carrier protein HutX
MSDTAVLSLKDKMTAEPGAMVETVAKEYGVTPRTVLEALPEANRRFAPGSHFVECMMDVASWGQVTLIIHTDDGVNEFTGPIAEGKIAQGYYNIGGSTGFHGHLRHERCAAIAFTERPLFGRLSVSMLFINIDGGIMHKVFVGRDDKRELLPDQLAKFRALADKICQ